MGGLAAHAFPPSTTATALATTGAAVNCSNAAPPTVGQTIICSSTGQLEWQTPTSVSLPAGWVSIDSYGTGLGTTATVAATDIAFATALATGANVYVPPGTLSSPRHYLLSTALSLASGQVIDFQSHAAYIGAAPSFAARIAASPTLIIYYGTTTKLFNQTASYSRICNAHVIQHPSYAQTSGGAHFSQGHATNYVYQPEIENCISEDAYDAYYLSGLCSHSKISHSEGYTATRAGFHVDLRVPYGDLNWTDVQYGGQYTSGSDIGLYVRGIDTSRINGLSIKGCATPIHYAADNDIISKLIIIGIDVEDSIGSGNVVKIGDGTNWVSDCSFTAIEMAAYANANRPLTIYLGTKCRRNLIDGAILRHYRYKDAGTNNKITNATINFDNNGGAYATGSAFELAATSVGGKIVNCEGFEYATGITVTAGATRPNISLNDMTGCTTAFTLDATAKASGRGVGNQGLADW